MDELQLQNYCEAGKKVSRFFSLFFLNSFVLLLVTLSPRERTFDVPVLNLVMQRDDAISALIFINGVISFCLLAAVQYERVLGRCLREAKGLGDKAMLRISYPSLMNYHRYSDFMDVHRRSGLMINVFVLVWTLSWVAIPILGLAVIEWSPERWAQLMPAVCGGIAVGYTFVVAPGSRKLARRRGA